MDDFLHAVGFGLVTASILGLASVAVSLQFSVTNIPNFAQGDIMTVGAYAAYVTSLTVQNVLLEALAAIVLAGAVSWAMNRFVIQPFTRAGARNIIMLVITFAVALILQSTILAIFGGENVELGLPLSSPHDIGPFLLTTQDILIVISAVVVLLGVHLVLQHTKAGEAQRAVADNAELARVTGINSHRVVELTWLASGGLSGLAGFVLAAQINSFAPTVGFSFLLVVFASVVVGGIGKIYGSMLGALLIGMAMEVSAAYLPADYKQTVAFIALILVLLLRPNGLFSARSRNIAEAQ